MSDLLMQLRPYRCGLFLAPDYEQHSFNGNIDVLKLPYTKLISLFGLPKEAKLQLKLIKVAEDNVLHGYAIRIECGCCETVTYKLGAFSNLIRAGLKGAGATS